MDKTTEDLVKDKRPAQSKSKKNQAVIVAVGTELLFGSTVNTNAAEISQMLHDIGIGVLAHLTVGDNPQRLRRMLEIAFDLTDMVLVTGGLGPTQDDLTKEIIAEFQGVELLLDQEAERRLAARFEKIGRTHYTENNRKQAFLPSGSIPFYNNAGTAPGFALQNEQSNKLIIALPGPPREMRQMMNDSVLPYLADYSKYTIYSETLSFSGIGESMLETKLLPLIDGQTDPTIATYAKEGECSVRITSMRENADDAKAAVQQMVQRAKELAER
jgi:nicotinamide-nucleotide amidase